MLPNNKHVTCTNVESEMCSDDETSKHDEEPINESLIHWFDESHTIKYFDITIIEIEQEKRFKPLCIFRIPFSEQMNFPTLFFGSHPNEITKNILPKNFQMRTNA